MASPGPNTKQYAPLAGKPRAARAAHFVLIITALLLPSLSLIPLGGLYLWDNGYLLIWAIASMLTVGFVFATQRWMFARIEGGTAEAGQPADAPVTAAPNPSWTNIERKAWADVRAVATTVDIDAIRDAQALFDLGHKTINTVANRIHAGKHDALWQFTMPEALAISERVSARLGTFMRENIPFGDRLTVSQVMQVYRWRAMTDYAGRAYDIWRIIRLSNPATALTNEARERLSRAMFQWGREHVSRRLVETYVEEVGRAAIDLYGGRLNISIMDIAAAAPPLASQIASEAILYAPIRIAVIAESDADRAFLANLLGAMEVQRGASIAAYMRGDSDAKQPSRHPPLRVTEIELNTNNSSRAFTHESSSGPPAIVVVALPALRPLPPQLLGALEHISAQSSHIPPLLVPVLNDGGAASADQVIVDELQSLHLGTVKPPVTIDFKSPDTNANAENLWSAIETVTFEARRNQLMQRVESVRSQPRRLSALRQSTNAAANLAKSALRFSRRQP